MESAEGVEAAPEAPKAPWFTLDFGPNGGVFAPSTVRDAVDWLTAETNFWGWLPGTSAGSHKHALEQVYQFLFNALGAANEAERYQTSENTPAVIERMQRVESYVRECFHTRKWPHSSTPSAQTAESIRQQDPTAAVAYLYAIVPIAQNYQFDARDLSSWRGFLQGIHERFGFGLPNSQQVQSHINALEDLRERFERTMSDRQAAFDSLHRSFEQTATDIATAKERQASDFALLMKDAKDQHDGKLLEHDSELAALRRTFREGMTLRAPVEYWQTKANDHAKKSGRWMAAMFVSMAALAGGVGWLAHWVLTHLVDGKPEAWRVGVLGVIAVLGIWALRMVVRMFLSHQHLATDAEERVTMVKTYLALLEADRMPADEDRKLVLAPLFRPAADGIVKDEGLPHPLLEFLTRTGPK